MQCFHDTEYRWVESRIVESRGHFVETAMTLRVCKSSEPELKRKIEANAV